MRNIISDIAIHTHTIKEAMASIELEIEADIIELHRELGAIGALTDAYALKAYSFLDDEFSHLEDNLRYEDKALVISYALMLSIIRDLYKETAEQAEVIEIHEVNKEELKTIKAKNEILGINNIAKFKDKAIICQISDTIKIYSIDIVFTPMAFKFQDTSKYWISNIRDMSDKPITIKLYNEANEINYKSYEDKLKADYADLILEMRNKVKELIEAKSK